MNQRRGIVFSVLFIIMTLFFSCKEEKETWKTVTVTKPPLRVTIAGFIDENTGITAGYAGAMGYTNDGGKNWSRGSNDSWCRFGLDILDKNTAWTSGNKGHNRVTHDGGKSWEALADFGNMEPNQCRYISYCSDTDGWLAAPDLLAATNDGGKSWKNLDLPPDINKIAAIHLSTPETGYVLNQDGMIFKTGDSAKTWGKVDFAIEKTNYNLLPSKACSIIMKFNGENGIIILRQTKPKAQLVLFYTPDNGTTWQNEVISYEPPKGSNPAWDYFLFLSPDWKYLTVTAGVDDKNRWITVLKRNS